MNERRFNTLIRMAVRSLRVEAAHLAAEAERADGFKRIGLKRARPSHDVPAGVPYTIVLRRRP